MHVALFGARVGFDAAQLRSLATGSADDAPWAEDERALLRLCDALHRDCTLDDALWHALKQHFGGVISATLDAMGGLAVMAAIGARQFDETAMQRLHRFGKLGTIDLRIDYLRPAIGERFALRAQVLRLGSRVASTRMEFSGADSKLLASGSAAYIVS